MSAWQNQHVVSNHCRLGGAPELLCTSIYPAAAVHFSGSSRYAFDRTANRTHQPHASTSSTAMGANHAINEGIWHQLTTRLSGLEAFSCTLGATGSSLRLSLTVDADTIRVIQRPCSVSENLKSILIHRYGGSSTYHTALGRSRRRWFNLVRYALTLDWSAQSSTG